MNVTERLERYAVLVESSPHNLMSRRGIEELRSRHIPESAAFAALLPRGDVDLLDVGAGGGLPGMVVAVLRPEIRVTLLDATTKKTDFLRETALDLGVDVRVVNQRAEDARRSLARSFDVVTARAVAPLDRLLGWTMPFLRPGGLLYAIKGERWQEEMEQALPQLTTWGAEVVATPPDLAIDDDPHRPWVVILRRGSTATDIDEDTT